MEKKYFYAVTLILLIAAVTLCSYFYLEKRNKIYEGEIFVELPENAGDEMELSA